MRANNWYANAPYLNKFAWLKLKRLTIQRIRNADISIWSVFSSVVWFNSMSSYLTSISPVCLSQTRFECIFVSSIKISINFLLPEKSLTRFLSAFIIFSLKPICGLMNKCATPRFFVIQYIIIRWPQLCYQLWVKSHQYWMVPNT